MNLVALAVVLRIDYENRHADEGGQPVKEQGRKTVLAMAAGTGGHVFPGWPWRRRCARAAGTCTGWASRTAWKRDKVRRAALPSNRWSLWRAWQGPGHALRCCRSTWHARSGASCAVIDRVQPDVVIRHGRLHHGTCRHCRRAERQALDPARAETRCQAWPTSCCRVCAPRVHGFPNVFEQTSGKPDARNGKAQWIGNPLREPFLAQAEPAQALCRPQRSAETAGGGRQPGCKALNDIVPQALALIDPAERPLVAHQSWRKQLEALQAAYAEADVDAALPPFIDDTAQAFGERRHHRLPPPVPAP